MPDAAVPMPVLVAACLALLVASGCATAAPGSSTPSPAAGPSTDRGVTTPVAATAERAVATPSITPSPTPSPTPGPTLGLADPVPAPGAPPSGILPAPAVPTGTPPPGAHAEVTGEVQAFIDAARALTARGEAITAASLASASPGVSALLAAGGASVTGDALRVYVVYADEAAARAAVVAAGGTVERTAPADRIIQASVPVTRLVTLQTSSAITRIRLPETSVR
jgi:hypothetical protein